MANAALDFKDEKSNKFWNLESDNKTFSTSWGRVGTFGQSQEKTFSSKDRCDREANKLIASKIKKGYVAAITEDLIREVFITTLAGVAEYKCPNEIYYRDDKFKKLATIEFVDGASNHIIFRHYYESGKKKSEHEWLDGKQHGKDCGWYEDGSKHWDRIVK